MSKRMRNPATLMALPLLLSAAMAQATQDTTAEEELRRYTVEMIIFSYAQDVSAGSEIFVPDEPPPAAQPDVFEFDPYDPVHSEIPLQPDIAAEDTDSPPYEFVMLDEDDYTLGDIMEQLQLLDSYQPLMHFGWTQPTRPEADTEPLELQTLATPPAGLEGTLTLYLSRYLHLVVDLQLDAAAPDDDDVLQSLPVRYRIQENRIIRNGELRYFDHPKFGVLAKIMRVEEQPELDELLQ